jgi:hypothetical protein
MLQHADDPWFIALVITMLLGGVVTLYGLRGYVKEMIVLAMAVPPAIFRKVFGPARR